MTDERLDQHNVAHDAATIAFAVVCGVFGGALERSWEVGVLMAGAIITIGILSMRIGPVRRGVNRAALAVREAAG